MKKSISLLISLMLTIGIIAPCLMGVFAFSAENEDMTVATSGVTIEPLGIIDVTPPVLTGISIDETSVDAPGTVTVTATASDDISGIADIRISFGCNETQTNISTWLFYDYWNEQSGEYENDGTLRGNISFSEYVQSGIYECNTITVYDKAGNVQQYSNYEYENVLPLPNVPNIFITNNTPAIENIPPELTNVIIENPVIEAPGIIKINATATDVGSGVNDLRISFINKETNRYFSTWLFDEKYNEQTGEYEKTGVLYGEINVGVYDIPGIYECNSVAVYDNAGNIQYYGKDLSEWEIENGYLPLPDITSITVINNNPLDYTPPKLDDAWLAKNIVDTPGLLEVFAEASDDLSGVCDIRVSFYCEETKRGLSTWLNDTVWDEETWEEIHTGIFKGVIETSVYELPGIFELMSVRVYDYAGNAQEYIQNPDEWQLENGYLPLPFDLSFTVINDGTFDLATNTNNPSLANEIAALPDGSTVGIDYGSNPQIGADVFAAAQGKDIDVVLIGNGIEWVFNGTDINNPKALNLSVDIAPIDQSGASNAHEIKAALGNIPAVVLSFPNNGQLPGKAKIRVKADSEFRQYLGVDNLYVYYFNNQTGELEQVKANVNVTHDGFIEFEITHNSAFVITKGEIAPPESGVTNPPINPPGGITPPVVNPPVNPDPPIVNPPVNPPTSPVTPSKSSSSSSKKTASSTSKAEPQPATVAQAISAYNEAFKAAKEQGNDKVIVRFRNVSTIPLSVIKEINSRAAKGGVSVTIYADTVENAVVLHRIAFDPAKATKDINASVSLDNANAINAANRFKKHFENKIAVIALGQGSFGVPVRISIKLDLSGFANPVLYLYDLNTNKYSRIQSYAVDKNGYLSFTTEQAGVVVVSDGELKKK